jgi:hypothetical protein
LQEPGLEPGSFLPVYTKGCFRLLDRELAGLAGLLGVNNAEISGLAIRKLHFRNSIRHVI